MTLYRMQFTTLTQEIEGKAGLTTHTCNPMGFRGGVGRAKSQCHSPVLIEFEVSLSYMGPSIKKKKSEEMRNMFQEHTLDINSKIK